MLVLALDTSTAAVTVALVDLVDLVDPADPAGRAGGGVRAELTTVAANRHGEVLAPNIAALFTATGTRPADLHALAVGVGPGPFTGLRVGIVTGLTISATLGLPAYGVCSLDALARRHGPDVVAATDARRREVYYARYDGQGRRVDGPAVGPPAALAERLVTAGFTGRLVGVGAALYRAHLDRWQVESANPFPAAVDVADLAADRVLAGAPGEPLVPLYLRRPDAVPPGVATAGTRT